MGNRELPQIPAINSSMPSAFRHLLLCGLAGFVFALAPPALAQQPTPGTGPNFETRLESLEDQMRTLQGRIEQLEFSIKRLDQALQRMQSDTEARLAKMESAPPPQTPAAIAGTPPPIPPVTANFATGNASTSPTPVAPSSAAGEAAASVNGTLGAIRLQDGRVTGAVNNPQAPPLPATPPDYGLSPQEQYDRAFDLLRQTDYEEAAEAFKIFIDKNPQDKLVDNAKYWYGETLYVRDKFDQAAVAFADAYQQNPQGSKAPDCLLKLALSLEKLDKIPDACTTLDSLKGKYPNASVKIRQQADQTRARLKCAAAH